jgi:glutathione reductase (NADPH)
LKSNQYDLFVIGAGSGGVRAARMAAATGAKVAVAEARFLGGTCVNVGCVPKKLFYYGAHYAADFQDAAGFGWQINNPAFNWPVLRDNKNAEIERLNGIYEKLLTDAGVTIVRGYARLSSANTLEIGDQQYSAKRILIATGCKPYIPDFSGSEYAMSSDDVFYLETLPKTVVVVGGGYIALEFAGIFKGLGVDTTLAYRGTQLLRHFDSSLGQRLAIEMQQHGIKVQFEKQVESIEKLANQQLLLRYSDGDTVTADAVLYATGRKPMTADLGLAHTAVTLRDNGQIVVDDYFQSAEPSIFALGDIIGTPELTPVALAQGMAFVDSWYKNKKRTVDYQNIATAVFSSPNIASVGLSEAQAKEQCSAIAVYESEFRHLKHTLSGNAERTYMKLIVDGDSDKVVGAHMMGQDAGEIIQGVAVAIKAGATKQTFDQTIGIHPTAAEEFVTMRTASRTA